jgi:virginiamycin B lyase
MTQAIGRITPSGDIVEFALAQSGMPTGIALGPDGNVWFTDPGVGRITPTGTITLFSGQFAAGGPFGITAGADGGMWFTDIFSNAIGRITP